MAINTSEILDILSTHNVVPEEHAQGLDVPVMDGQEFPEISEIEEGETVYTHLNCRGFPRGRRGWQWHFGY